MVTVFLLDLKYLEMVRVSTLGIFEDDPFILVR